MARFRSKFGSLEALLVPIYRCLLDLIRERTRPSTTESGAFAIRPSFRTIAVRPHLKLGRLGPQRERNPDLVPGRSPVRSERDRSETLDCSGRPTSSYSSKLKDIHIKHNKHFGTKPQTWSLCIYNNLKIMKSLVQAYLFWLGDNLSLRMVLMNRL